VALNAGEKWISNGTLLMKYEIREIEDAHRSWMRELLEEQWSGSTVVTRGRVHEASLLPGFIALDGDRPAGLVTYCIVGVSCELVTLNSLDEGRGIGSALTLKVKESAQAAGCQRLWLITTNDNKPALRFYQRKGFRLAAVHRNAIEESRKLKPEIPLLGLDDIPIRDELELEMDLRA
jgi:ribosomal protein S18 acetylase RimI-like enzyme